MTISAWQYVHFCGLPFGLSIFLYLSPFALPLAASLSVLTFLFVSFSLSILAASSGILYSSCANFPMLTPRFASCFFLSLPFTNPPPRLLYLFVSIALSCVNYRQQRARWDLKGFFFFNAGFCFPEWLGVSLPYLSLLQTPFEFCLCMPLKIFHHLPRLKNMHSTVAK